MEAPDVDALSKATVDVPCFCDRDRTGKILNRRECPPKPPNFQWDAEPPSRMKSKRFETPPDSKLVHPPMPTAPESSGKDAEKTEQPTDVAESSLSKQTTFPLKRYTNLATPAGNKEVEITRVKKAKLLQEQALPRLSSKTGIKRPAAADTNLVCKRSTTAQQREDVELVGQDSSRPDNDFAAEAATGLESVPVVASATVQPPPPSVPASIPRFGFRFSDSTSSGIACSSSIEPLAVLSHQPADMPSGAFSSEQPQTDQDTADSAPVLQLPYFETQVQAQCGRHALNHLYGGPQFTAEDLKSACGMVLAELTMEAQYDETPAHHARQGGWYSHSVLAKCFDLLLVPECKLLPTTARSTQWARFFHQEVRGCLVNQDNQHWLSIRSEAGRVFLFDSLREAPEEVTEQRWEALVRRHPSSFWVVNHDSDLE